MLNIVNIINEVVLYFDVWITQEIMHWYCAIRSAKIKLMKETFPERSQNIVSKQMPANLFTLAI